MRKLGILLIGVYIVVATWLAIPTIMEWQQDNEYTTDARILDASGSDKQWEFLKDYAELVLYANDLGYKLTAGELKRTLYQQKRYVFEGKSLTFNSYHLKSQAGDLNLFIDGKYRSDCGAYEVLGEYWKSLDERNVWGGNWNWKDCVHFERNNRVRKEFR